MFKGDYPDRWSDYIGQDDAKRELRIAAKSARTRGATMPHTLIAAPYAGVGKTTLAVMAIRELGRPVLAVSGPMKLNDVLMMFTDVKDGDVIFIDEIHRLGESGGARGFGWMLSYMTEGVLMTPAGVEEVPAVTIIGATTEKGSLPEPILQRFKVIDLERYNDSEGAQIAAVMAQKVLGAEGLPAVSSETAASIAAAGANQPRLMKKLLVSIRDLALCEEIPVPADGKYDLSEPLAFAKLTADGLTHEAQQYLTVMFRDLRSAPAGEALMRRRLGVVGKGLHTIEQLLLDKGYIVETKQGRMLTADGRRRAKLLLDPAAA